MGCLCRWSIHHLEAVPCLFHRVLTEMRGGVSRGMSPILNVRQPLAQVLHKCITISCANFCMFQGLMDTSVGSGIMTVFYVDQHRLFDRAVVELPERTCLHTSTHLIVSWWRSGYRASDFRLSSRGFDSRQGVIKSPRSTQPSIPLG